MDPSPILIDKADAIATITLNRPEALNAQTPHSLARLDRALLDAARDDSIAVIILRGAGRSFCAGMDLKTSFGREGRERMEREPGGVRFDTVCETMERLGKPVIAAVQGHAVTGGFLLAYTADLLIAADNALFMDTHARWGLIPGAGESQRMPRRIGLALAKELFFTCAPIDAQTALRVGLANRVVPPDRLDEEARAMAARIAANSPRSIAVLKSLLNDGARTDFARGMALEAAAVRGGLANLEPDADRDARLAAFRDRPSP
jgi:enoyl-CoA hydratase/carnithine racemase